MKNKVTKLICMEMRIYWQISIPLVIFKSNQNTFSQVLKHTAIRNALTPRLCRFVARYGSV